jgi:hypothetical protein
MLEIILSILAALGGGAVIIAGFTHWLGNIWAKRLIQNEKSKLDLEIEAYKVKLKKSEFIFEKQYEAASELTAMIRKLLPPLRFPEMEWCDACDEIAQDFERIIAELESFLSKHGAILDKETRNLLSNSVGLASQASFDVYGDEVPHSASDVASDVYNKLVQAEENLIKQVMGQVGT